MRVTNAIATSSVHRGAVKSSPGPPPASRPASTVSAPRPIAMQRDAEKPSINPRVERRENRTVAGLKVVVVTIYCFCDSGGLTGNGGGGTDGEVDAEDAGVVDECGARCWANGVSGASASAARGVGLGVGRDADESPAAGLGVLDCGPGVWPVVPLRRGAPPDALAPLSAGFSVAAPCSAPLAAAAWTLFPASTPAEAASVAPPVAAPAAAPGGRPRSG